MKRTKFLLLIATMLITSYAYSQKIFIGNEETNRKLSWSDFKGTPDRNSQHYAITAWEVNYAPGDIKIVGDSVHIGSLNVVLIMNTKKSWCRRDKVNDELLKHEQGHFDIGILCVREFLTLYSQTHLTKRNFSATLQRIFNETMNKYSELGKQYDRETNHSMNKDAQKLWNEFFEKYI